MTTGCLVNDDCQRSSFDELLPEVMMAAQGIGSDMAIHYLRDATNRRFWVVDVAKPVNTAWLHKHRAQLFAEAHHRFRQGKRFTPSARQEERYFAPAALRASKKGGAA